MFTPKLIAIKNLSLPFPAMISLLVQTMKYIEIAAILVVEDLYDLIVINRDPT